LPLHLPNHEAEWGFKGYVTSDCDAGKSSACPWLLRALETKLSVHQC
jgi:hypothetical protein